MTRTEYLAIIEANFGSMTADDFGEWLGNFFIDRLVPPALPRIESEPFLDLIHMFHALPEGAVKEFRICVDRMLDVAAIPSDNSQTGAIDRLFYLVQLANVVKPENGKRVLRRMAAIPHLFDIYCEGQRLHSAILNAVCRYNVDPELAAQIIRLSASRNDFDYLVMCMRLVSYSMDGKITYALLERIIPWLQNDTDALYLAREIVLIIKRLGAADLLTFYQKLLPEIEANFLMQVERFRDLLREKVLPRFITNASKLQGVEPAAVLLGIQIDSDGIVLGCSEIRAIAEMAGSILSRSSAIDLLTVLRSRYSPDDCSTSASPTWEIVDNDEIPSGLGRNGTIRLSAAGESLLLSKKLEASAVAVLEEADQRFKSGTLTKDSLEGMGRSSLDNPFTRIIGSDLGDYEL